MRAIHYEPGRNLLYVGGDFDSIQIPSGIERKRPDNDASCGQPAPDSSLTPQNRCIWERSKIAAYEATTGFLDAGFQGPTSTGAGLIGQGGKTCSSGSTECGTGAVQAIQLSPDKQQLFASGSFSEMDNNKQRNTIMALYADGPDRGQLTPWQPRRRNGIPIFDIKVAANTGMLFVAGGGAGGRAVRWDPQIGSGGHHLPRPGLGRTASTVTPPRSTCPTPSVTGAATSTSSTAAPTAASTPPPSTSTGTSPRTGIRRSTPARACSRSRSCPAGWWSMAGNFSRVNRRPQPGIAVFLADAGRSP